MIASKSIFVEKPYTEYYKNERTLGGYVNTCKKCQRARVKRWKQLNPERVRKHRFKKNLNVNIVIPPGTYDILLTKQNGKCAICGVHTDFINKSLSLDHDHKTNKLRGLLCGKCNFVIGNANDNVQVLEQAIEYLKRHSESPIINI